MTRKTTKSFCRTVFGDVFYWTIGSGPPLLLLHQASQSSVECQKLAASLKDRFTVISLDYPGHGVSDDPPHELGVPEFCSAIIAVLDELDIESTHIGGHHSGGILAIYLALNHADRVLSIALSGIGVRTEESVRAVLDTPMTRDIPVDDAGDFISRTWSVYRRMSAPGIEASKTFEFFMVGLAARLRPFDAHFAVLEWDWSQMLRDITKPTLLVVGEFDYFAETPDLLLEQIDSSKMVVVPGGGAFLFYEKPAECAAAITAFIRGIELCT